MELRVRLKEVLEERGMTQKDLAALTGMRESVISELANNKRNSINVFQIGTVAKALGITDTNTLLYFIERDK